MHTMCLIGGSYGVVKKDNILDKNILLDVCTLGQTKQCLGLTLGSVLRDRSGSDEKQYVV